MRDMNLFEEARFRLACCMANTCDGHGDVSSLRNHMMAVAQRIKELDGLYQEVRGLPKLDPLRFDDDVIALMNEYRGLLAAKKAVCEYLGIESPVVVAVVPDDREPFKDFLARLLG